MRLFAIMAQLISLCSCIFTLSVTYLLFKSVESELFLDDSQLVDDRTYDEWFQSGMNAYNNEEWHSTIWYFENGIKEFKYYRSSLAYCRIKCSNLTRIAINDDGLNEQRYFQVIFKKALCIRKCKHDRLGSRPERINQEVTDKYLSMTPYSYLQFAYYKVRMLLSVRFKKYHVTSLWENSNSNLTRHVFFCFVLHHDTFFVFWHFVIQRSLIPSFFFKNVATFIPAEAFFYTLFVFKTGDYIWIISRMCPDVSFLD